MTPETKAPYTGPILEEMLGDIEDVDLDDEPVPAGHEPKTPGVEPPHGGPLDE